MRNKKGLFAFLTVGAVIFGLAAVFNYGLAVVGDPPEGTPTPTPTKTATPSPSDGLAIDFSGLKAGIAGKPYSGVIKAKNAKNPKWTLGNNNLSEFGLTAPAISFGGSFSIKSINSTSAREGTATGTVTLISRIGKTGGGIETDEISGDFKIEIKKGGGSGGIISPKINSFTVNGSRSVKATEGDEIEFKWAVRDDTAAGFATGVELLGRLTPQSDQDPAGQQNICVKAGQEKCGLSGSVKVNIHRSSAFTLKAKNTLNGKSKTATSAVYVIVKPKPPEKFGTVVVEGTLDGNPYAGRVTPADAFKFFKNSAEQEKININSLPKVFNRAKGNYKIETEIDKFQLFSATGKKIPASLKDISPASGELKSGGTVRLNINFKTETAVVLKKYSCNAQNACVRDDANGTYADSDCNNACGGGGDDLTIITATLADATVGAAYSQSLSAAGGTAPYTWSITSGKLPAGLTLNSAGVLSGTPKKEGAAAFTVKAEDKKKKSVSKELSLTVDSAVANDNTIDFKYLGNILDAHAKDIKDITACPPKEFLMGVIEDLRKQNHRWGYDKHKAGGSYKTASDRVAWYKGSENPDSITKSSDLYAFDVIKDYCTESATPRKPKNINDSIGTGEEQWMYPKDSSPFSAFLDEPVLKTSVIAELETEELTPTPDLAVVGEALAPNKSLIARGLDAVDTIALPVQFYTEKFFQDMTSASFWKKVKKGLEIKKSPPKKKLKSKPSPTK